MKPTNNTPVDEMAKPTFDGRQIYYKVVQLVQENIIQYSISEDWKTWYRLLRRLYSVTAPYIGKDVRATLGGELDRLSDEVKKYYNNPSRDKSPNKLWGLEKQLDKFTTDIYQASRHLLLPLQTVEILDEDHYDDTEFMRMSDL